MTTLLRRIGDDTKLEPAGVFALLVMVMIGSAIVGWLYEKGFYYLDSGGQWVSRGHGFGPWLPIYGFGGLGMLLACWGVRDRPGLVFVICAAVSFVLEYATGWVLFNLLGGLRLWDYNVEIWNWGNIGGYVCARSVLLFAVAGIALVRWVAPMTADLIRRLGERRATCIATVAALIYAADIVYGYFVRGL